MNFLVSKLQQANSGPSGSLLAHRPTFLEIKSPNVLVHDCNLADLTSDATSSRSECKRDPVATVQVSISLD